MPTVSIIMATYNQADFIEKSVRSVLSQTFADYELIVVNDGSTDETDRIFKEKIKSEKIIYCFQANKGAASARNKGLSLATGEYVVFLDSDDLLYPNYLERQVETIRRTGSGMVACDFNLLYSDGTKKNVTINIKEDDQFYQAIIQNQSPPVATMLKRSAVIEVGFFDESVHSCEDYDLFLRMFAGGNKLVRTRETLCEYVIHPIGKSTHIYNMIKSKTKIINKLNRMLMGNPNLLKKEHLKELMDQNLVYFHRCLALNIDAASTMPEAVRFMEKQYAKRQGIGPFLVKCLGYARYNRLSFIKSSLRNKNYGKMRLDQELAWRRQE